MTTFHSIGDVINGFQITDRLGEGGFTVFYRAQKNGRDIFLKQYKEPTKAEPWFDAYVNFEQQVKHCIQTGPVKDNVYDIVDIFEWNGAVYQALEFVPNQTDLWDFIIANQDDRPGACKSWEQRVLFAKMLMDCIKKLHASGIVHCDLKPQNVVLISDPSVKTGFLFRIADLDWSFINSAPVPWDGYWGFVGTPCFLSPEHLRHERPTFASDVFTCGIMLYLLLCNYFPFDNEHYEEWTLSYDHFPPDFLGTIPGVDNEFISVILRYCVHPDPNKRPTAEEVHLALLGRLGGNPSSEKAVRPDHKKSPLPKEAKQGSPVYFNCLQLLGATAKTIKANIKTDIGKYNLQDLCGEDAKYADTKQYTLLREGDSWFVIPNPDAPNETLLNGKKIVEKTPVKPGDKLGVGREEKGIVKAVVTVK